MIDDVEALDRGCEGISIAEIASAKVYARHRAGKGKMTAEGPHTRAARGETAAQVGADEAPTAEHNVGKVTIRHADQTDRLKDR